MDWVIYVNACKRLMVVDVVIVAGCRLQAAGNESDAAAMDGDYSIWY